MRVDHVLVVFFNESLYFANAAAFRREIHQRLRDGRKARHLVIDAVASADIDYTGLVTLAGVVDDLAHEQVNVALARANDTVRRLVTGFADPALAAVGFYDSVDEAAGAVRRLARRASAARSAAPRRGGSSPPRSACRSAACLELHSPRRRPPSRGR